MELQRVLQENLSKYPDISVSIIKGLSHTHIRVMGGTGKKVFSADVFILRRTGEHSIARIDNKDVRTLAVIQDCLLDFTF